jgi:peptidylprolyl isomerase
MGTDKRERQKAGRVARAEAARNAQRKEAMRKRITTFAVIAAVAALLIGVYLWRSGDDSEQVATTSTTTPVAGEAVCVELDDDLPPGTPPFEIPLGPAPSSLEIDDLVVGDGAEAVAGGEVTINYIGVSCSTGKIFDSSYQRGEPATFALDGLIQGWQDGIPGMKVGGQRLLVIPPELGYGAAGRPPQIAPNETLIFLVELVAVPEVALALVPGEISCVPLADELPPGTPPFEIPVGPAPTVLETEDLVVGSGAEAVAGGEVTINYIGVSCSTGKIFDSSYQRGEPATFALDGLIQGWQEGIPGMKVGGQRLLIIPSDLGYGPGGSPPSIAGNETLIFLVELVAVPNA